MFLHLAVIFCCVAGVFSQCYEVYFRNAYYHPEANGVYYRDSNYGCDNRDVYRHEANNGLYMYYVNGYWCIYDDPCSGQCYTHHDGAYFRAWDSSQYPEYILLDKWEEYSGYDFVWNYNADVDCHNNTNLSTGAIIGICAGCLVFLAIVVAAIVFGCKSKKSGHHNNSPPRAANVAVVTPPVAYGVEMTSQAYPAAVQVAHPASTQVYPPASNPYYMATGPPAYQEIHIQN